MKSNETAKHHRRQGIRANNSKSAVSTSARRQRLDDQVRDAEEELRYWTR